jgi:alcohol dehydrogenase YqhD (iron-dependent ADH family)
MKTRLRDYDIPGEAPELVAERIERRGAKLGEHTALGGSAVAEILRLRY